MRDISKDQIIAIHALLNKKGLMEDKQRLISEASGLRTIRCSQLTFVEAQNMIMILSDKKKDNPNDKRQRMVKYIMAMAHEIGFIRKEMKLMREGELREVNNYDDLHAWIKKYGYLHKDLNDYKYEELPTLVTQFTEVWKSKMNLKPKHVLK